MKQSLYIHIPFCERKCFYCSFVVSIAQEERIDEYLNCIEMEMGRYPSEPWSSIYIGGGTPSLLSAAQLGRLLKIIADHGKRDRDVEFTVELNPESISAEKIKVLLNGGVNRLSMGVQTFHDHGLNFLGRNHTAFKALESYELLRREGADNINIDLMFAYPNQDRVSLEKDLAVLAELRSEHVSLYGLTIDEKSRFFVQKVKGHNPQREARDYSFIIERLAKSGLKQYEISNFARSGRESRHNINYWRGGNYIGLGVGAHSHKDGRRFWNKDRLTEYLKDVQQNRPPVANQEVLTPEQRLVEAILFGLRMNEGVDLAFLRERFGCGLDRSREEKLQGFVKDGFLLFHDNRLRTTLKGRMVLDEISARLI